MRDTSTPAVPGQEIMLRLPEVRRASGLSRSTIYRLIQLGEFPPPVKLGALASGWLWSEVADWIAARVAASRNTTDSIANRSSSASR